MSDNKPNDHLRNRKVNPYNNEDKKPNIFEKALKRTGRLFKDIGQLFVIGYKKYDAFIKHIFKLEEPSDGASRPRHLSKDDEMDRQGKNLDDLSSFTRKRNKANNTVPTWSNSAEKDDTQDFNLAPDYLQIKTFSGPAPLADLEPSNSHDKHDEHEHHWNIFKKRLKPRSFITSTLIGLIKILVAIMLIMGTSGLGLIQGIANAYVDTTPELDLTKIENQNETSFIYDGNGNLVTSFVGLENRISASIDEVPDILKYAFVAIEDERFYTHTGFDIKRIFGAFFSNLRTDKTQGGSTITQQLIKLRILSSEQTYKRKIQEAYLATELEKKYTKDEILVSYMNTMNLGSGNYGIKAASRDYFGKELNELTLRECAMLAAVANSSYLFNPRINYYVRNKPEQTDDRTDEVLYRMYRNGYISKDQYEQSLTEQVFVIEESAKQQMYDMPYFLEYAIDDVVAHFIRQRNLDNNATNRNKIENELRVSGYHIYTTVDPALQQIVEETLYNWDKYPRTRYESDASVTVQNPDGTTLEVLQPQAAATVFDYHTGQLKAIVGGRQEPQVKKALNRAVDSNMPVGSSIKPLAVYGPALNLGVAPSTVIFDLPLPVTDWISTNGYPNNYGGTFSGPVTMREALYRSINNAASRVLMDYVTLDESYRILEALGVSPSSINKDGSGLALGTSGINVLEMAVAYGAIGNSGSYIEPIAFTQVVDSEGNILLDATNDASRITRRVFTDAASWLLVDMMEDVVSRGTGVNAQIDGITVAGKTGTNTDNIGVFFAGLTPYYSATLWVGHDSYKQLYKNATGSSAAAPLWQSFMSQIHEDLDLTDRPIISDNPSSLGLKRIETCPITGLLATEACKNDASGLEIVTDWVIADKAPTEYCTLHNEYRVCLTTGKFATPFCHEGSQTDPYNYVVIPPEHILNQLSAEEFAEYFPSGLRGLPEDLSLFTYDNPDYAHYFCDVHTLAWHENQVKIQDIASQGSVLVDAVELILINYNASIDAEVRLLAEGAISDLKAAITAQNYSNISSAINELTSLKVTYLDPIVAGGTNTPEPSVTPTPVITPTPTPAPEG